MLASAAVRARAEQVFLFRSVDSIRPKGFAEAIEVSELRSELAQANEAEIAMCRRWDEVFTLIAKDGAVETTLARLTGFLLDYPADGIAQFHARRLRAAAQNPGEAA
ncbi:hypothetical protein QA649_21310 [Bradyrhizobium sp. CB1717]|uniref:hypothetical protein n=1 Tax=Bradyrhizobium sp. CB1717 TaxID=3039154 RepID=UPI0024B1E022|nr:hypothetical protein [Bradyrhizobium sp. CB1717]WFU28661.1 hypothetical protein QA649_21310 [Bradyrhizobium sp. CB1717]